jgi:asparagine synthase (glutamine-hydrolysing)
MCGIAGKLHLDSSKSVKQKDLRSMVDAIAHRGPDSHGIEIIDNVGLGHARLAIVDLSVAGHQPMLYDKGNYWITFNGEIYNFADTRAKLQKKGYTFKSKTDTEVMLAAYKEYGDDCVKHFRGMFAFAIYDKKRKRLFAARDRLGKKPFKYFFDGKTFLFASELKSLLSQPEVHALPDPLAIEQYLYWGYVPSPRTGFSSIAKLPPGHTLTLDLETKELQIKSYWKVPQPKASDISYEEAKKKLRTLVYSAVEDRLMSDVPLGAFLSGGIDSAIVVGAMSELSDTAVQTFTVGFPGWENDERILAAHSAKKFGTRHLSVALEPKVQEFLPELVEAYEEPFGDSSGMPSFLVSQVAREQVTVALNGDGGDENFFGYSNYTTFVQTKQLGFLQFPMSLLNKGMKLVSPNGWKDSQLWQRAQRISHLLGVSALDSYALYVRGYLNGYSWQELINSPLTSPEQELGHYLPHNGLESASNLSYIDFQSTLPDGLMPKVDIASMHYGLESRSPFLDHRIVEFSSQLPIEFKYDGQTTKKILRDTFSDLLAPEIANQPKKGFNAPVKEWLSNEFATLLDQLLKDKKNPIFEVLNFQTVREMTKLHRSKRVDFSTQLWRIIMLQLWYNRFFKNA